MPIRIDVTFDGHLWWMQSADRRLAGAFTDRTTAIHQAKAEIEAHPDYVLAGDDPRAAMLNRRGS